MLAILGALDSFVECQRVGKAWIVEESGVLGEFKAWENVGVLAEQGSVSSDWRYWESMQMSEVCGSV